MKPATTFRTILFAVAALALLAGVVTLPTAAQTRIDLDVKRAVVRIVPERCYGGTNCIPQNNQPGSGVIIHPTGLILTAWHVLSVDDNLQQANSWDDFVIEVIDNNDSVPPTPRYRAKIVATRPEMDLAILRIDRMLDRQPVTEEVLASLAWLPVYSGLSNQLETGVTPLPVLGYPIPPIRTGRTTLFTNQRLTLDSHNVPDAEMWVQWPLDKGYSGGPGLVQYGDELQVAGIVRAAVGNRTELRDLSVAFNDFVWQPGEQRMYADKVVVTQTSVNGSPYLQFEAAVHALGWESAPLQFQISFFEADSHQPWRPTAVDLPQLPGGQVYWIADVRPDRPVYRSPLRVMIPIAGTDVGAQDLAFRIKLGRADPFAQLWSDNRWYQSQSSQTVDVSIPPTSTPTPTPTATNDRVAAIEADVRATLTASAPTATRRPPTATATPTPTVTPTFDPAAQIAAAVAATLTALAPTATVTATPTDTPTATATANATATFQAAVQATLTALAPTRTPTRTPTRRPPTHTPTAISSPTPGAGAVREIDGIPFVYVPAGEFTMGSTETQIDEAWEFCKQFHSSCARSFAEDESPQHRVYVGSFWVMRTEVTNAQFRKFVDANGYTTERYWTAEGWKWRGEQKIFLPRHWTEDRFNGAEYPVVGVSWYEAMAYANWLSAGTGLALRLLTEAEWEKAARGADGRIYPWGNDFDGSRLNYCDINCEQEWKDKEQNDGYQYTAPVGSYAGGVTPYGAHDMAGNVWEWANDWYSSDYYTGSPGRNPPGPEVGERRVLRGGSWVNYASNVRAAGRIGAVPVYRNSDVGFRLVAPGN